MSKVIQTTNVQAQTFGFANNVASAYGVGESAACTISSLVVSGTSTTNHAANDSNGQIILVSTNSTFGTAGSVLYGVVQSHTTGTSAAFTVDAWYNLSGAKQTNTAANSGVFFVLLPVAPPFWYIALTDSVSAVSGSGSDTSTGAALGGTELTTNGLSRAKADTITRTVGSTSATMAHTFNATGTSTIGRVALVNSIVGSSNYTYFVDQVNGGTATTVNNLDTFTPTYTITLG